MDFRDRLQRAIDRGSRARDAESQAEHARAITEKELQRLHSQYRLDLCERIERCLKQVADHFPGFQFASVVNERGWGAAIQRDDLLLNAGERTSRFSRLELLIRPISPYFVLELAAKATVYNKELFNRNHYQPLAEVDLTSFTEMIDNWTLEYAEAYAAKR